MYFLRYFTFLGNLFPQFLICLSLFFINVQQASEVFILWFFGYAVNFIIKNTIRKERPPKALWRVAHVNGHSYPSGHSLTSFVLYFSIAKYFLIPYPWVLLLYAMPFILGLSRLYLRVHHVEDVIGGWIIAYAYLQMASPWLIAMLASHIF